MKTGEGGFPAGAVLAESMYRDLVDNANDIIYFVDLSGAFSYINNSTRALGYEASEIIGRPMLEFIYPEDHLKVQQGIKDVMDGKCYPNEFRVLAKDGRKVWFRSSSRITLDKGKAIGINGIAVNIMSLKEAEAALRESETKLRLVAGFTYDWETWIDPEGRYIYMSPSCERITGYSGEELTAMPSFRESLVHPDDKDIIINHFVRITAEELEAIEFRIITKEGKTRWLSHACKPVFDDDGTWLGRRGSNRDITVQKEAELELKNSNLFLNSIIQNIPDMIFVKDAKELRFVMLNKVGETLFGASNQDTRGKNDFDFFPKEQAEFFTGKDREVISSGKPLEIPEEEIDSAQGKRTLHTKKIPLMDAEGKPAFLLGISHDITERKKLEEKTKVFSQAVGVAYDGVVLTDMNGSLSYANESAIRIFGYSPDEMVRLNVSQFDANPESARGIIEEMKTKGYWSGEVTSIRSNKETFPVMLSISLLKDDAGNPTGMMGVFRDITARKKAEEALHERTNELERFNKFAVDRELKMVALKKELEELRSHGRK